MKLCDSFPQDKILPSWQDELKSALKSPLELLIYLGIDPKTYKGPCKDLNVNFKTRVPRIFADKMQKGLLQDPLLRQVLPLKEEDSVRPHSTADPLLESTFRPIPGILHKYKNRALLILTGACAVHCRYCFRKNFPYQQYQWSKYFAPALDYIEKNENLREIILSGGDPLSLKDSQIFEIIESLSKISHVKIIRFHTRFPVVIPQRLSSELLATLTDPKFQHLKFIMVLHVNHPSELDLSLKKRIKAYKDANILFFNQSVLLKSINDNPEILIDLSWGLFEWGIIPYYIHLLDPILGTVHFEVGKRRAKSLIDHLKAELPGYLVPRLVKEQPGYFSKYHI